MLEASTPPAQHSEPLPGGIVAPHNWILYLDKISVSFDGFRALNNLNLYIERGELRCVIGPNGAGKTTMMDVITGKTRPDEGTAFFAGTVDLLAHDEPERVVTLERRRHLRERRGRDDFAAEQALLPAKQILGRGVQRASRVRDAHVDEAGVDWT